MPHPDAELVAHARAARAHAYAPYSHFAVGAAIRTIDGQIFTGCNIENASYGLTNCAERVAVGSMIAAGAHQIATVAVVAEAIDGVPTMPCGACRQVLAEFGPDAAVLIADPDPDRGYYTTSMAILLPHQFSLLSVPDPAREPEHNPGV
jgi:cytidine deaminase